MRKYLVLIVLPILALYADVTKETYTKVRMVGGMATSEVTSKVEIRSDAKMSDDMTKLTTLISPKPTHTGEITRLDKELIWNLQHGDKTYTESPLKPPEPQTKTEAKTETRGTPDTTREYRLVKSEFSVKKLDSARTINGFPCAGYLATWTVVLEKIATKEQSTSIMSLTEWTTPFTDAIKQAQAQEAAFNKAYVDKLGLTMPTEQSSTMGMEYMMTIGIDQKQFADQWQKNSAEMAKIQGYPIVTELKWLSYGDTSKTGQPEQQEESKPQGGVPNLSGMLGQAIANKIAPKPEATDKNVVFSSYLEVKSIAVGATADKDYEVPAGYKKN